MRNPGTIDRAVQVVWTPRSTWETAGQASIPSAGGDAFLNWCPGQLPGEPRSVPTHKPVWAG